MISLQHIPPMLTEAEKADLYKNWDENSWKTLAERNIRLALKVANSFQNTGIEFEDLFGIACVNLTRAAKNFNPEYGIKFSTFAMKAMQNGILMEIRKRKNHPYPDISLDSETLPDENICLKEAVVGSDDFANQVAILQVFKNVMNKRTKRDREIINKEIEGYPQASTARLYGVSQSTVNKIVRKFRNDIKKELSCLDD